MHYQLGNTTMNFEDFNDKVVYIVEATSFERLCLWQKHKEIWGEGTNGGPFVTIGHLDNRPICITLSIDLINNQPVLFYECTSQLADYKMVDQYIKDNYPNVKTTDAMNFHNCMHYTRELKNKQS